MLAAQAQNGRASNVWVVNVTGDEPAEIVGIFARSAASAVVQQKTNAVDIVEQPAALGECRFCGLSKGIDPFRLTFPIQFCQFANLAAVGLGCRESQFLFERLLQDLNVLVLTKNQRNDEPVVSCARLTVGAVISQESLLAGIAARSERERVAAKRNLQT